MKTFKYILLAIISINVFVWLITYFLNINLFSILQIQNFNLAIEEPRYKLNPSSSNAQGGAFDQVIFLYDSECNKFGPFSYQEVFQEISDGLNWKCEKDIPNENEVLIYLHERREGGKATVKSNITNLIYSFPGFEGDEETGVALWVKRKPM